MKGAMYRGPRRVEVVDVERPAVGEEDVMVKVANCGICGSDVHAFVGELNQPRVVGGHEISGEVVEVGSLVSNVVPGDRVALEPFVYCGQCRYCLSGNYNLCEKAKLAGFAVHGGFAEYVVMPAYACLRVPSSVSFEQASTVEPLSVAVHGVRMADVGWGDSVVILGSSTIGLYAIAAARAAGASTVIASAKYEHQGAMAEEFGATHVVSSTGSAANEEIARFLGGRGADVVMETVGGAAATFQQALQVVRKGGRISLIGVFSGLQSIPLNAIVVREIQVIGSYCYNAMEMRRDFDMSLELIASGRVVTQRAITHRFKLSEIQQAFDTALDKSTRSIKVMVEV